MGIHKINSNKGQSEWGVVSGAKQRIELKVYGHKEIIGTSIVQDLRLSWTRDFKLLCAYVCLYFRPLGSGL